jgi:hypothetical protein
MPLLHSLNDNQVVITIRKDNKLRNIITNILVAINVFGTIICPFFINKDYSSVALLIFACIYCVIILIADFHGVCNTRICMTTHNLNIEEDYKQICEQVSIQIKNYANYANQNES